MCTLCPTVTSDPMTVGWVAVQWMIDPSCTLLRGPISIRPSSPRSTAVGQIDASAPIVTLPITTASGCT